MLRGNARGWEFFMQNSSDLDRQLHHMRSLREEYLRAVESETEFDERWRLRKVMHELHRYILELENQVQALS